MVDLAMTKKENQLLRTSYMSSMQLVLNSKRLGRRKREF